jgi:hypothetical protein
MVVPNVNVTLNEEGAFIVLASYFVQHEAETALNCSFIPHKVQHTNRFLIEIHRN